MVKIKRVPKKTTGSIATLVCPSGFSRSLPNERPSSRYVFVRKLDNLNLSIGGILL